ncbi:hypothetical protein E3N88_41635 [Mikania micrantha]|uniref:Retrovirus-related Pol polyprotein from transposon TNT 1-94-like beta-barrel domain-containing protein n=1 Tax=Mikania micrantha TaxID=192012 RepID=A0A5N6LK53_9ASTR|nr:hypothetical protein E3N88_41635 [Mikania micrantha]
MLPPARRSSRPSALNVTPSRKALVTNKCSIEQSSSSGRHHSCVCSLLSISVKSVVVRDRCCQHCCVGNSVEYWILDSGALFHVVSSSDLIKNLRTGNVGKVRLADDQTLDIVGIGDVDLRTSLGSSVIQKDYVEFEDETLDKSGESVTPEVVFDMGAQEVEEVEESKDKCYEFGRLVYTCTKWKDKKNEEVAHLAQFGDNENPTLL